MRIIDFKKKRSNIYDSDPTNHKQVIKIHLFESKLLDAKDLLLNTIF